MLSSGSFISKGSVLLPAILAMGIATGALAEHPRPVQVAVNHLADELGVLAVDVQVVAVEQVTWRDSSLGVPQSAEVHLAVLTPGYRVQLSVAGERFVYHTDMQDRVLRAGAPAAAAKPAIEPPAEMQLEPWPDVDAVPKAVEAVAQKCRADLAKRLGVSVGEVIVEYVDPVTFRDTALGLPQPGEQAAEAATPGHRLSLAAGDMHYVYTTAGDQFRYGGPYEIWFYSLLYLRNGALMQASLLGSNAQQIVSAEELGGHDRQAAIAIHPQDAAGGIVVIAQQAGPRPRSELRYLSTDSEWEMAILGQELEGDTGISAAVVVPDSEADWNVRLLEQGLEFRGAAVSSCSTQWMAFARNSPGAGARARFDSRHWRVIWGQLNGADGFSGSLTLPEDATPVRLDWWGEEPEAVLRQARGTLGYRLVRTGDAWQLHRDPSVELPGDELRLSRSETLKLDNTEVDGQPAVRVVLVRFDGQEKHLTTLENFRSRQTALTSDKRFALVTGVRADAFRFYTVDLASGQVLTQGDLARFGWPIEVFGRSPQEYGAILGH